MGAPLLAGVARSGDSWSLLYVKFLSPCPRNLPQPAFCSKLKDTSGFYSQIGMQRLTARVLLLLALAGTLFPVVLQARTAPPHACCLRKASHHCHDSSLTHSEGQVIQDAGCCRHDCRRAVTSSQWAHPLQSATSVSLHNPTLSDISNQSDNPFAPVASVRRSRAPPAFNLA